MAKDNFGQSQQSRSTANSSGVSRRTFLKTSGILAGVSLFAGAGLMGCAPKKEGSSEGSTAGKTEGKGEGTPISYAVYDTDVLVIGSGFGATTAALEALSKGARVMMIDKGPSGFGGASGFNFDQEPTWPLDAPPTYEYTLMNADLANQKLVKNVYETIGQTKEAWNLMAWWTQMGNSMWRRFPDGSFEDAWAAGGEGFAKIAQRGFFRHALDKLKTIPVKIIDHTMITDIYVQDGKCAGAIGYDIYTGEYKVFRAKATVASSGPCCQMYGWVDIHPVSNNTPDNTGDIDAAAYRHGCSLISNEFFGFDLLGVEPSSLGVSFNSNIGADGNHSNLMFICDKDGEYFMRDHKVYDCSRPVREKILEGKAGPNDEVYVDLTKPEYVEELRPTYRRNIDLWKKQFGIDVTEEGYRIPVKLEAFEHAGSFLIDENASAQIPGLFGLRGYGMPTNHISSLSYVGTYAGKKAAEYAAANTGTDKIDWAPAEAEIARLEEIRTREVKDGIRPLAFRHLIQTAFYAAYEPACDAEGLQACIDEIERIKKEDLPRMVVADKDVAFNRDWKEAIENFNILDLAEAAVRAALMREESRGFFFRKDFPEIDEKNWHTNITCTLKDGQMVVEKSPQVFVEGTEETNASFSGGQLVK